MKRQLAVWGVVSLLWCTFAVGSRAQQSCDDGNDCTGAGICLPDNSCSDGVPVSDGTPCGGFVSACMMGQTCQAGVCMGGTAAADGTPCKLIDSSCFTEGACMSPVPGFPFSICMGSTFVECTPDSDPCTAEICNFETGQCDSFPACLFGEGFDPQCSTGTCNPANGQCTYTATSEGAQCDDFNDCTVSSRCTAGRCVTGEPTGPTPTPTMMPTPTPTTPIQGCIGDCNEDGEVTVDDLIIMVNIAQGSASLSDCPNGDANNDGEITIDDILQAVNMALNGC